MLWNNRGRENSKTSAKLKLKGCNCKGHTRKGYRDNVVKDMSFNVFAEYFQGVLRVFSGCFSLCPFRVCPLDTFNIKSILEEFPKHVEGHF